MSVLVKNMKMPESCGECRMTTDACFCSAMPKEFCGYADYDEKRPDWCPLVELPEKHKRLVEFIDVETRIDEDTGTEEIKLGEVFAAYFKMREAKAVIEAEGEG